jgi:post-segregation antitoxin (ccd killing protein)
MTPKEVKKREPTSIKIDPELWKAAKIEAVKHDMQLSELVETGLSREIDRLKKLSGEIRE